MATFGRDYPEQQKGTTFLPERSGWIGGRDLGQYGSKQADKGALRRGSPPVPNFVPIENTAANPLARYFIFIALDFEHFMPVPLK